MIETQTIRCGHCGGYHSGQCPKIAEVEYYPDGTVKRVKYHSWPEPVVTFLPSPTATQTLDGRPATAAAVTPTGGLSGLATYHFPSLAEQPAEPPSK